MMVQVPDEHPRPIDHLTGAGEDHAPALIDRDGWMDYACLDQAVGAVALRLVRLGLVPGDRVATWLPKHRLACLMPLAAARAGLIHVPVNPLLKHAQVRHILADSGARLLITGAARAATMMAGDVPDGCAVIEEGDMPVEGGDVMAASTRDPAENVAILYTSGSTGRPKGVVLNHVNLWLGAVAVRRYLNLDRASRTLCVLPLSFDYGQNQLFSTWAAGGAVIPFDFLLPRDVVKAVERFEVNVLAGVPPLWSQLVATEWPPATAHRLRVITNSGGRLAVPLVRQLRALFPHAALHSMYGLTEAFRSTSLDPALIDDHPDSIGTAIPFAEIRVLRPDGTPTADGEAGELVHGGPLVAQGYWRDPDRTAQRFRSGPDGVHVWSGDRVVRGADGLLRFVGRDDEMIKTAGNRVSPTEIEEAAIASGIVSEAVAWGIADPVLGQVIGLAVNGDTTQDSALRHYLKQELPNFMQPHRIVWHPALPRNANGKLDRAAIARGDGQ